MTGSTPPSVDLLVKLADEGVPLRAIVRATGTSPGTIVDLLKEAKDDGRLVQLPQDDWPPGFPRDQRALQLSRLVDENRDVLFHTVQQMFRLTRTEVQLLLTLVQKNLPKDRYDMASKTVEVHICSIRKRLSPFGIDIKTLWGYGYQLSPQHRQKIMDIILSHATVAA